MNKIAALPLFRFDSAIFFCGLKRIKRLYYDKEKTLLSSGEVLALAVSKAETKEELQRIHDLASKVSNPNDLIYDVETLEGKKQNAEEKWRSYQRQISRATN